jgi:hypothetical protein
MTEQDQPAAPAPNTGQSPIEPPMAPPMDPAPGMDAVPPPMAPPPAPAKPSRMRMVITWAVILGFLGVVLFVVRNQVSADDLVVGQCFDVPDQTEVSTVEKHECTESHDAEVFHVVEYSGSDDYPISLTFDNFVDEQCIPAFATYVGDTFEEREELGMGYFYPSNDTWDDGDRTVTCYLGNIDETKLTKSLKNSGS